MEENYYNLGKRYFFYDKENCYKNSLKAKELGYEVEYGRHYNGQYFFKIIDPFEGKELED